MSKKKEKKHRHKCERDFVLFMKFICGGLEEIMPKEKRFYDRDGDGIERCTDEAFGVSKAEGWNACLQEIKNKLSKEK